MKNLAIITARGGSKRIPRKNIKDFLGKPIIVYSIEAALQSKLFDEVMVSTDDPEIAEVSKNYGATIPFMRSQKNSDDFSTTSDVIMEVLEKYKEDGKIFDYCCCIYPTAPFLSSFKLKKAYNLLVNSGADALVSITKFCYPVWRSFKVEDNLLKMNWPEYIRSRSQDLSPTYHDAGQFYFLKYVKFLEKETLFTDFTIPFFLDEMEVQDVDTEEDWKIAELKYKLLNQKGL